MPAILNLCGNLTLGATMALAAKRSPAMRHDLIAWPLLFLLLFEGLFVTPIATYLFRFYPQWSMLYWFDPQIFINVDQWTGWLSALAITLNFVAALAGYMVTRRGVLLDKAWVRNVPLYTAGVVGLLVLWQFGDRVVFVGDYDAYWQGQAALVFTRMPGWIGLGLYLGGFLFVLWVHSRFGARDPQLL